VKPDPRAVLRNGIAASIILALGHALETDVPALHLVACSADLLNALLELDDPPELSDAIESLSIYLIRAYDLEGPARWTAVQGVAESLWPHLRPYLGMLLPPRTLVAFERTLACRSPEAFTAASLELAGTIPGFATPAEPTEPAPPPPPRGPGRARSLYVARAPRRRR